MFFINISIVVIWTVFQFGFGLFFAVKRLVTNVSGVPLSTYTDDTFRLTPTPPGLFDNNVCLGSCRPVADQCDNHNGLSESIPCL